MASAVTQQQADSPPLAQAPASVPRRAWVSVDSGFTTLVALAALAIAAFTYLNIRIDNVATELRGEIRGVNARIDTLSSDLNTKIDKLNDKIDTLSARTDDKIDRLTDKINELLIEQKRGR